MATEQNSVGINGNYAATQVQGYAGLEQSFNSQSATGSSTAEYNTAQGTTNASSSSTNGTGSNTEIPKDEVGWYFVEQYYTTLSRSPEKLFLFYNKKSQYVSGTEAEKVAVCVGQKAINDHIKALDIQDCKVRVTNVDSQGSGSNIVIQVIGEISNKSAPQRKFTQTFVLAEQQNGYFVLNDIFRYILDDEEVPVAEEEETSLPQPEAATGHQEEASTKTEESMSRTLTSSDNLVEQARDVDLVNEGLEQAIKDEPSLSVEDSPAAVNGEETSEDVEIILAEDAPAAAVTTADEEEETPEAPVSMESLHTEEIVNPEAPRDPEPTPAASPPKPAPAQIQTPAAPSKPAAPKTWASMVSGGNRIVTPIAPVIPAVPSIPSQPSAPAPVPKPVPVQAATAPAAIGATTTSAAASNESDLVDTPQSSGSEWQTAGHDHGKKQGRAQTVQVPAENSRGYIKSVSDQVEPGELRNVLSKVAEITYLDINRQKSCAFVDFASPTGYQAAIAANPHEVNGERLYIEERRVRPGGFSSPFNGPRGGNANRGRGGAPGTDNRTAGQGRGGFPNKEGGRGGFTPRGRGGMGGRGRGGVPAVV